LENFQLIAVTGGAFVPVNAQIASQYVEIIEDGSGSAAGLKVKFPADGFTAIYEYPPGQQPIKLGVSRVTGAPGRSPLKGVPAVNVPVANGNGTYTTVTQPATVYAQVESMGAVTVIRVREES
jgi:hypothetical protein